MAGWKKWVDGEKVEADDFQSYVQNQVVQVYANSGSRGSALGTAVAEGMISYLLDVNSVQFYNGSSWADIANPGDITAVTAGTGLTGGGVSGDITLDVNYSAVASAVLASPNITGTATIAAGSVTGNLVVSGFISDPGFTASRAIETDASKNLVSSTVTATELGYLSGVTSALQTQINGRVSQTNGTVTTAAVGSAVVRNITASTAAASGGSDGDVWLQYTP